MHASPHTRLMNKFIGLCKDTAKWPNTLRQLGYEAQLIEQEVSLESAVKVTPEVIVVSKKLLHAIAAECKSGGYIDDDQYDRYKQLKAKDLYYAGVDVHAPNQLTHVVCYVDDESNHASFVQYVSMPFITFGTNSIRSTGDFNNQKTNQKLREPIPLTEANEPSVFYPFSPNDGDEFVMQHVLVGLFAYLTKKPRQPVKVKEISTANAILELIHPYHKKISIKHKKELALRIKKSIDVAMGNKKFREQVVKIENGERSTPTLQSFNDTCKTIVDDAQRQERITRFS